MNDINKNIKIFTKVLTIICTCVLINVCLVAFFGYHLPSGTYFKGMGKNLSLLDEDTVANRGKIMDNHGTILAYDVQTYMIVAVLDKDRISSSKETVYVKDKENTAKQLAPVLGCSEDYLLSLFNQDLKQTYLGEYGINLSLDKKNEIIGLKLPGIEFANMTGRYYPYGSLLANTIGYTSFDPKQKQLVGKMGVEKLYNNQLTGTNGHIKYQIDAFGRFLPDSTFDEKVAIDGNNVYLTIDKGIQEMMEQALKGVSNHFNAQEAWGAVVEVETGKILSWAQYPSFDLNNLSDLKNYYNLGFEIPYEVGSTMKPITYAIALETTNLDPENTFDSTPFYIRYYDNGKMERTTSDKAVSSIRNFSNRNWGTISHKDGLMYSANTGIADLMVNYLDTKTYKDYMYRFGFFNPVNSDLFTDDPGVDNMNYPIEYITSGYGQGSTFTMAQLLQAYTAIYGDGSLKKPYMIDKIVDSKNEVVYQGKTQVVGKPISEKTAKKMQELLTHVVEGGGSAAGNYKIPEVKISGKTGTGEIAKGGNYNSNMVTSSVILGMPADNPKVICYYAFVAYDNHALNYAPQYFKQVLRKTATTLGLKDGASEQVNQIVNEGVKMPNVVNYSLDYAYKLFASKKIVPIIIGNGNKIVKQFPNYDEIVYNNRKVFLLSDASEIKIPNLKGYTLKEAKEFFSLIDNVKVVYQGNGKVKNQSLSAGSVINTEETITIELE
ncbi:MAG: penicillin-binding protein [Erysipelotrichaceae bacterium]